MHLLTNTLVHRMVILPFGIPSCEDKSCKEQVRILKALSVLDS